MKIGKFKVTREVVFAMPPEKHCGEIFRYAIPVKIEWIYQGPAVYTAICEWFDDIVEGKEPPFYEYTITSMSNGTGSIQVKRIE